MSPAAGKTSRANAGGSRDRTRDAFAHRMGSGDPLRRKQTILSLIDMLSEMGNEVSLNPDATLSHISEEEDYLPTSADEQLSNTGAEQFFKLERRIQDLDEGLHDFANAVRQVGGSLGLLYFSFKLRGRLANILFLFRENAANLYPRRIARKPRVAPPIPNFMGRHAPVADLAWVNTLGLDTLPAEFTSLAKDTGSFLDRLNEPPEFSDNAVNKSMRSFECDLKYWASCLAEYESQFRSPAVGRYVHDLAMEIGDHIDDINDALHLFTETGIPTIKFRQEKVASNSLTFMIVTSIFSVITAIMLGYSYSSTGTVLAECVNVFWFSSLLVSIAATMSTLLGLTRDACIYRSPENMVPWWLLIWIKDSPPVLLMISVACFLCGFTLFMYSSRQGFITSTIILVLIGVASLVFVAVSGWFALERWTFVRYKGQKWLGDVIEETMGHLANSRILRVGRITLRWCRLQLASTRTSLRRLTDYIIWPQQLTELPLVVELPSQPASTGTSLRGLVDYNFSSEEVELPPQPRPRPLPLVFPDFGTRMRVASTFDKLKALDMIHETPTHKFRVQHLQFSPNGRYLATASLDKTSVTFCIERGRISTYRTLAHPGGFIGQVSWSPDSTILLTRLTREVKVWSEDGVCRKTIDRPNTVQCIVWLPTGDAFLSVEGSDVVKLDVHGKVLDIYHLEQVRLIAVSITPDGSRLVGVGPSLTNVSGSQVGQGTRVEKRIVVYNMLTKKRESQTPLIDNVRDVTMARKTPEILISSDKSPPQLWKLELVRDQDQAEHTQTSQLNLVHKFVTKGAVDDTVGPSHFGGQDDQFVLSGGKAGEIYIWDRETAALVHSVRPREASVTGGLTCIAWNCAMDDPLMLATGSYHGMVRIYSTTQLRKQSDRSSLEGMEDNGHPVQPGHSSGDGAERSGEGTGGQSQAEIVEAARVQAEGVEPEPGAVGA